MAALMYAGWLAIAQGLYQLQIGMSFESDKSDSYFTRGVRHGSFNGAISLFGAENTEGTGEAASFPVVSFFHLFQTRRSRSLFRHGRGIESELQQTSVSLHAKAARNFLFKMLC